MSTEEHTLFGELANALMSWRVDTSGDQKNLRMHRWNIRLLTNKNDFNTIVEWLEYHKDPNYARAFESKFQNLYKNVDDFYDKLIQEKLDEEEFHEQIQLLEDEAKQLAQHVSNVEYLCLNDKTIQRTITGDVAVQESKPTGTANEEQVYAEINLTKRHIVIGKKEFKPTADSIWEFLKALVAAHRQSGSLSRHEYEHDWKNARDCLGRPEKKGIGRDNMKRIVNSSRAGYSLAADVQVK